MTLPRAHPRHGCELLAAISLCLLSACAAPPPTAPRPQPTPTCQLQPQATGEKYVGPTVEASPPARVAPGQAIAIMISGAYGFVRNNAVVCGDGEIVDYVFSDELPTFNWRRAVEVRLDGRTLTVVECENPCRIEFALPPQTPSGTHALSLVVFAAEPATYEVVEPIVFEIEVAAP